MITHAATLSAVGEEIRVEQLELLDPQEGEVLVRMHAAGVCHSDWHVVTGATPHPLPVVLGHEGSGIVESVGAGVTSVRKGDHVSLNWAPSCGTCFYCTHGRPGLCGTFVKLIWAGTMLNGSTRFRRNGIPVYHFSGLACFSERTVVPEQCCVRMPRDVPFDIAALIGCAVTTGVGAVLNTAKVPAGSSVAVLGCGGVGLSVILGAILANAGTVIAVDRIPGKEAMARSVGASHFVCNGDIVAGIKNLTEGRGADYVFEAVGSPALQEIGLEAVRPGGTLVLAGISPVGTRTNLPGALLTRQEKTVMGSYYGTSHPQKDFPLIANHFLEKRLPIDRIIGARYSLDEINTAYRQTIGGQSGRGVIVF
ncbi:MAG: Zn-dependent alcohol dehydrogenase [Bacteroidota bacterium]